METIVIFNAGKNAAMTGQPRIAPASIMYPIVSQYDAYRHEEAFLSEHQQREWLRGYDKDIESK